MRSVSISLLLLSAVTLYSAQAGAAESAYDKAAAGARTRYAENAKKCRKLESEARENCIKLAKNGAYAALHRTYGDAVIAARAAYARSHPLQGPARPGKAALPPDRAQRACDGPGQGRGNSQCAARHGPDQLDTGRQPPDGFFPTGDEPWNPIRRTTRPTPPKAGSAAPQAEHTLQWTRPRARANGAIDNVADKVKPMIGRVAESAHHAVDKAASLAEAPAQWLERKSGELRQSQEHVRP